MRKVRIPYFLTVRSRGYKAAPMLRSMRKRHTSPNSESLLLTASFLNWQCRTSLLRRRIIDQLTGLIIRRPKGETRIWRLRHSQLIPERSQWRTYPAWSIPVIIQRRALTRFQRIIKRIIKRDLKQISNSVCLDGSITGPCLPWRERR